MKAKNSPITTSGSVKYKYDKNNRIKTIITTDETGNVTKERISREDRMKNAQAKNPIYIEEDSIYTEKKDGGSIFDEGAKNDYIRRTTPRGY